MARSLPMLGALLVLGASPALADIEDDQGSCVHERQIYPEGSEICENGMLKRCEDGDWSDIGRCEREAPERKSGGGDGPVSEEQTLRQ
jgi:hypothetical protein